jgi:hypothetical protein
VVALVVAEVDRLDVRVETLAEAHAAAQARLDGLIQAAHRHQADLERSELALQATRAAYAGDVREAHRGAGPGRRRAPVRLRRGDPPREEGLSA